MTNFLIGQNVLSTTLHFFGPPCDFSPSLLLRKFVNRATFLLCMSFPIRTKCFPAIIFHSKFSLVFSTGPVAPFQAYAKAQFPGGRQKVQSNLAAMMRPNGSHGGGRQQRASTPHPTSWPPVGQFVPLCLWRTRHPMFAELAGGSFGFEPNAEGFFSILYPKIIHHLNFK